MVWLFDKKLVYNWTVNPDKPGLADFLMFCCKLALIGVLASVPFISTPLLPLVVSLNENIVSPVIEEQARLFWMYHAREALRAGMAFAVLLSIAEFLGSGHYSGSFESLHESMALVAVRAVPTLAHIAYTMMGYVLLRRQMPVVRVWLMVVAAHISFNVLIADAIGALADGWSREFWGK